MLTSKEAQLWSLRTLTKQAFLGEDDVTFGMVGANLFLVFFLLWKIHRKD